MTDAPLVLAFDTSGPWLGVCLLCGQEVLAERHETMPKGQGETLFPALEQVLSEAGVAWRDLDALGVGIGPGNFTGIRIAVAAARGLSLSLGIPAVGVSILEAMALGQDGPVLAAREAPRGQAYIQSFDMDRVVGPDLVSLDDLDDALGAPGLTCVGDAGAALAARLGARAAPALYAPASAIARIAATRYAEAAGPPAPLYLKPADAAPSREAPPVILDDA